MSQLAPCAHFTPSNQACKPQDPPNENSDPNHRNYESKADDCSKPAISDFWHQREEREIAPERTGHGLPLISVRHTIVSMTNSTDHVEIITSVQRRRRWTASEKVRMVEETFEPGMTVSLVARRHGVAPNQLFTWRRLVAQGGLTAAGAAKKLFRRRITEPYRTKFASFTACSARRHWRPRFSRKRSNTPRAQKNSCGCRRRCRRTVPDEGRRRSDRGVPLQFD